MPPTPPSGSSAAPSPNTPADPSGFPPQHGGRIPPNTDGNRVIRRRNRIPLSCAPCRSRKLKCNRSIPCENCVKRGDVANCSYATPTARRAKGARGSVPLNPDDMQDRINRLEALVLNLVQDQGQQQQQSVSSASPMSPNLVARTMLQSGGGQELTPSSTTDTDAMDGGQPEVESETEQVANSLGVMHVAAGKSMYIGNTHWAAVLDDITEVKNFFVEHKKQYEEQMLRVNAANNVSASSVGPSFLLYAGPAPSFIELLNMLPGKESVDKLIEHYFEQYDKMIHIVHPPTWRKMYDSHWHQPEQTDPAFLAQIFAMMGISLQSYKRSGNEPPEYRGRCDPLSAHFRQLTIQCFALVDYTKPSLLVLEAMVMHARGQAHRSSSQDTGVWVLQATIVRIAMRMGLHRDPKHFSQITPFLAEMRRRIWTWVRMSDTILSQHVSLPSMVRVADCDTELPSNLYDEELDENMVELPPSRPPSQFTPITYMIGKSTIANILGKIVENVTRLTPALREEVEALDTELQTAYQQLPSVLHPSDDTFAEQASTLHMRFSIGILYHKSMCVLHREFLAKSREDERLRESRRRCIDSALKLLQYQAMIYWEARPLGTLPGLVTFDTTAAQSDFLLAGTIVLLDLWYSAQATAARRPNDDLNIWGRDRRTEIKEALEASRRVWDDQRNHSMEAYKACSIIGVMLNKIHSIENPGDAAAAGGNPHAYPYPQSGIKGDVYSQSADEEKPEHTAAMTLGMLSTGMGQGASSSSGGGQQQQQSPPGYGGGQYPTPSSNTQTPGDLAAAAQQAAGFDPAASTTAQYADLFNNMHSVNIDWGMWDTMLSGNNLDPAANDLMAAGGGAGGGGPGGSNPGAASPSGAGGTGNWQPVHLSGLDADISLPQQAGELNTNLFANAPSMFQPGGQM